MSLDAPPYLNSLQNSLRARPIPWEGAVRLNFITDNDLKRIKAVDKVRKEQRKSTVESDPDKYRSLLLGSKDERGVLDTAARRQDVLQYILVLMGDLMNDVPDFSAHLLKHPDPYKFLTPLLSTSPNPEEPIPVLASSVLAKMLAKAQLDFRWTTKSNEALRKLYDYLGKLSQSQDSGLQDIAMQDYSSVLRSHDARRIFWEQRKETLGPLIDILRTAGGVEKNGAASSLTAGSTTARTTVDTGISGGVSIQLLYHVLLVIWQFSYEASEIGKTLDDEEEIIALYTHLLRLSPKEKTTRLILSTLYNLISADSSSLLPVAASVRLPALITSLKTRHLNDEDLLEDLKNLDEMLADYTSAQTTLDEYASEVRTGHLRWSPPHRDPNFWSENAEKILTTDKGELVKQLSDILSKSWDTDKQVLAVGCNDVGWLVKTCPEKRSTLEKLGIKARVMGLMADSNESVRWESLRAVGEWMRYSFEK